MALGARFDTLPSRCYPIEDMAQKKSNIDSGSLNAAHRKRNLTVLELLASRPPLSHEEAIAQADRLRQQSVKRKSQNDSTAQ